MVPPAALGVDFGTSHTIAVARSGDGGFTPLLFDGSPMLPSAVFAETDGGLSVGRDAVHSVRLDPARFEPHPKRCVDDGTVLLGDREFSTVDLISAVLSQVQRECSRVLGGQPGTVTLTCPAAWGPTRRLVLADAAEKAGLAAPETIPEPVAAATYFARQQRVPVGAAVVVADFGGGTFDCSLVRRNESGFDVVNVDGHDQLGGVDVDEAIVARLRAQIGGDGWSWLTEPATAADRRHRRAFYDDVRAAKERLSRSSSVDIYIPVFDRDVHFTREELETVARPLVERAVNITRAVIRASGVKNEDIAGLFLVGGGSRMPLVSTMLHQATGLAPTVQEQPELVVAQGALSADARQSGAPAQEKPKAPLAAAVVPPAQREPEKAPDRDTSVAPTRFDMVNTVPPPAPTKQMAVSRGTAQPPPRQPAGQPAAPAAAPAPAKRKRSRFGVVFTAVIVVMALLGTLGFVLFWNSHKDNTNDADEGFESTDGSRQYEPYEDPNGMFAVEIPKGWVIEKAGETYVNIYDPDTEDRWLRLNVPANEGEPSDVLQGAFDGALNGQYDEKSLEQVSLESATLSGVSGSRLEYTGTTADDGQRRHAMWIIANSGDVAHHVYLSVPEDDFSDLLPVYEHAVDTYEMTG